MTKAAQNVEMVAGDTLRLNVAVVDPNANNAPVNITGATIKWAMYRETGQGVALTKQTGGGITITDGLNGLFTVALAPTDTAALTPDVYVHESKMTDEVGDVSTLFVGNVTISATRIF